jgi:hypothetical protein
MNMTSFFRPAHGMTLLPVEDEAILFDPNGQRLFHLNPVATFIWSLLRDGQDLDSLARASMNALSLPRATARHFVIDMLRAWHTMGLLQDSHPVVPPDRGQCAVDDEDIGTCEVGSHTLTLPKRQCYRFLDSTFSVGFSCAELEKVLEPVFRHLVVLPPTFDALLLDVIDTAEGIRIVNGDRIIGGCSTTQELAPLLHGLLGLLAIRRSRYLIAIHGSALVRSGNALILAGRSGSGKTTMAAGLLAAGWSYMSDDTVLLLQHSLDCIAAPYALTLKEGAWPLLRRHFPAIDGLPIHIRADGLPVRYLSPPSHDFGTPRPIRWIGFPHHSSSDSSSMRPLHQIEGLYRLLEHCCAIPCLLQASDVGDLVRWSAEICFFEFAIADLDEAIAQVDHMTAAKQERCVDPYLLRTTPAKPRSDVHPRQFEGSINRSSQ